MANGIIGLGSSKAVLEGRIVWESSSNGVNANSSYVAGHLQVRRNDGYSTKGTWTGALNIGGDVRSFSNGSTSVGSDWVTMIEFYINQGHNNDGTGSCFIEGYCNGPNGTSMAGHSVSGNALIGLDTIPRYADIIQFDVSAVNESTIRFTWGANASCDAVQYSVDGGGWTDGQYPTTDIGGLSANAQHSVRIRVKRADSQLWTESEVKYVTTYDIGRISSLNDFEHGDVANISITNPSRIKFKFVNKN